MNYEASHYAIFFHLLGPNILLSILFSYILHLCYYLRMSVQVPHTYTTGSKISPFFLKKKKDKMTEDSGLVETCINYMLISQFQES